jgi:hypothetical protein
MDQLLNSHRSSVRMKGLEDHRKDFRQFSQFSIRSAYNQALSLALMFRAQVQLEKYLSERKLNCIEI